MKSQIKNSPSAETPVASKASSTVETQNAPPPRPWTRKGAQVHFRLNDGGDVLCDCSSHNHLTDKQQRATAALIVQCVNSFEEMKEALKRCVEAIDGIAPGDVCGIYQAEEQARAALAKVEQQTQN